MADPGKTFLWLKAWCWRLVGASRGRTRAAVTAAVADKELDLVVRITLGPYASVANAEGLPGLHLGPSEKLVYNALARGPLPARRIAAALGWQADQRLQHLLAFLVERGVLTYLEAEGYGRAGAAPPLDLDDKET